MNGGVAPLSAAPTARAAAPAAHGNEAEAGNSGFAAALEDAQGPVKPKALTSAAKAKPSGPAKPAVAPEAKAGEAEPAPLDAASPSTSATVTEPAPAPAQTSAAAGDDAATPDLSLLLPGWPETTALRRADARTTALDDGKDRRARPGAGVEPLQRDRTEPMQGATELRLAAAGLPASAKPGPGPTTSATAASAEAVASTARAGAEAASALPLPLLHTSAMPTTTATMAAASAVPTFEAQLAAALDSPAFAPALATQVSWLVREGVQHARLSLNPAEMGPLTVQIAVDGTQARVDFSAEFAATRAAIESSLPTLAAALHDRGLTLAGGGVFDGQPRPGAQGERGQRAPDSARSGGPNDAATDTSAGSRAQRPISRGLVDLVA